MHKIKSHTDKSMRQLSLIKHVDDIPLWCWMCHNILADGVKDLTSYSNLH